MMSSLRWVYDMMTSDDKVGGWVKKGQNHDDVILECPLRIFALATKKRSNQKRSVIESK